MAGPGGWSPAADRQPRELCSWLPCAGGAPWGSSNQGDPGTARNHCMLAELAPLRASASRPAVGSSAVRRRAPPSLALSAYGVFWLLSFGLYVPAPPRPALLRRAYGRKTLPGRFAYFPDKLCRPCKWTASVGHSSALLRQQPKNNGRGTLAGHHTAPDSPSPQQRINNHEHLHRTDHPRRQRRTGPL